MPSLHLMLLGGEEVGEERARENPLSWVKDHPFLASRLGNHLWSVSAGSSRDVWQLQELLPLYRKEAIFPTALGVLSPRLSPQLVSSSSAQTCRPVASVRILSLACGCLLPFPQHRQTMIRLQPSIPSLHRQGRQR